MRSFRRRFDLQNPSRMDRNVEMFMTIEKTLVQVIFIDVYKFIMGLGVNGALDCHCMVLIRVIVLSCRTTR